MATNKEVDDIVKKIMANKGRKLTNVSKEEENLLEELLKNGCLKNGLTRVSGRYTSTGYKDTGEPEYESYIINRERINELYF